MQRVSVSANTCLHQVETNLTDTLIRWMIGLEQLDGWIVEGGTLASVTKTITRGRRCARKRRPAFPFGRRGKACVCGTSLSLRFD